MFKVMLITLTLFSALLFAEEKAPTIFRDGGKNSLVAAIDTLAIEVHDGVTGGCLPNPSILKDKLEIKLRKNGFKIEDDPKKAYDTVYVEIIGYKMGNSSCVVHASANLYSYSLVRVPHAPENDNMTVASIRHYIGGMLLSGDKYSMQSRLEKQVDEYADKLYLNVSRAKDDTFGKFPSIKKSYEDSKK